jgi:hypothetical protein
MSSGIIETKVRYDRKDYYVYQNVDGEVLWSPTDFIMEFEGDEKTKNKYRKAIRRLFKYIDSREHAMTWLDMNDDHIEQFRDWSLEETKADSRYRGEENLAKQTTNHDFLMPIYAFYYWVQKQGVYGEHILGHSPDNKDAYQISSSLLQRDIAISKGDKPNNDFLYPKLFKNCDTRNYKDRSASEDEHDELNEYIIANFMGYERASLLLIAQITNIAGGRPVSIASLSRYQFYKEIVDRELFKEKKDRFDVVPKKAKFGNTMPIRFPVSTTLSVMSFIENDLEPFLSTNDIKRYEGHLFLNPNTLKPLSANDISKIFSGITSELGWPKGKSIYSLRHKFSNEQFDKTLAVAIELGFSANEASIALQMQKEMTHKSDSSLKSYVESRIRLGQKTEANKLDLKIKALESDKQRLLLETQKAFEIAEQKELQNQELLAKVEELQSQLLSLKTDSLK